MGRRGGRGITEQTPGGPRRGRLLLPTIIGALVLGGCVDEETGRQFANEPLQTAALPTESPTWPVPSPRAATPQASPVSPAQLLRTRGAAGRFYFRADGEVWTMAPRAETIEPVFEPPIDTTIQALASSPSGDRVAAIVVRTEGEAAVTDLVVLTLTGEEVVRHEGIDALVAEAEAEVVSLDWSPQGDKLLLALSPGGLVAVSLADGSEPELIVADGVASQPAQAAWSPTGEEVGFLGEIDTDRSSIYIAAVAATPIDPTALLSQDDSMHTVFDWAWLPDGRSLIFSEARGTTATADLWRINSDGTDRELVASAGSVAPVARVVGATPSRDGRSVAYIVLIPGDGAGAFDSLWVRDLVTNLGFEIDVPAGQSVTDVWWTDAGLMFRAVPNERFTGDYIEGPFTIYQVADGSAATVSYEVGMGPLATPAATPVEGQT